MILIVNYALRDPLRDYTPFNNAIKTNCVAWWHFLDSTYIVSTGLSADQFATKLLPYILETDSLFVARLHSEQQGWLPKEAWDWLNNKTY